MGTEEAINKLHIKVSTHLDKNKKCLSIFRDHPEAFDVICYEKLMESVRTKCWFTIYLEDGEQKVRIETSESESLTLKAGTPQKYYLATPAFPGLY